MSINFNNIKTEYVQTKDQDEGSSNILENGLLDDFLTQFNPDPSSPQALENSVTVPECSISLDLGDIPTVLEDFFHENIGLFYEDMEQQTLNFRWS